MRLLCGFTALALCAAAQPVKPEPLTEEQRRLNLASFEAVWTTVRERHFDADKIAALWEKARGETLPKVKAARSMEEYRSAMRVMLGRLGQSHFAIIPAKAYTHIARSEREPGAASGAGAEVREDRSDYVTGVQPGIVEGRAIVVEATGESPAAKAGVRSGWWIAGVNQVKVDEALAALEKMDAGERARLGARMVESLLEGRLGEKHQVSFEDGGGKTVTIALELAEPRGRLVQMGNMPPERVWFESRRVGENVGYVRFNIFADPETMMPEFERAVLGCMDCKGFILDLRGNPGGIGGMAMGMAGWFVRRGRQRLGVMRGPGLTVPFEINPRARTFNGPLAMLIDENSASTSEILAAGLRDIGRARLFGARTMGAALPSVFMRLPNGDGFQYAVASYVSQSGKALEGVGVEPDVAVAHTRQALLEGRDRAIEAAVDWIHGR
jgi:carboxyl-terminal processing protease